MSHLGEWPRGVVPTGAKILTSAVDLGKYLAHWVVVARFDNADSHVTDYGRLEIPSDDIGVEQAILVSRRQFRDQVLAGWPVENSSGDTNVPGQVWIDAGYMTDVVYRFCHESGRRFHPSFGRGVEQQRQSWTGKVTRTGSVIKVRGEGYHVAQLKDPRVQIVEVDADHWKTWVYERLATPLDQAGRMTFFKARPEVHLALARHLTAESKTEEFVTGKGVVAKWERVRRQNHWFDALYNACAAGHACKVRLIGGDTNGRSGRVPGPTLESQSVASPPNWIDKKRWLRSRRI